jgi:hypothetical protein
MMVNTEIIDVDSQNELHAAEVRIGACLLSTLHVSVPVSFLTGFLEAVKGLQRRKRAAI